MLSVNEIIPNLWLGNENSSQNIDFLRSANISLIINATKHIPNTYEKNIDYYRVPVNDPGPINYADQEDNNIMSSHIHIVLELIRENLLAGKTVLVHCHAGRIRSATIVLLYLVKYVYTGEKKTRLRKSLRLLLSNRPCVFHYGTNTSFKPAIIDFIRN